MYGKNFDRVDCFRFLMIKFDSRLTWREHVTSIVGKKQKNSNVIKCLTGLEWGTDMVAVVL